MAEVLEDFAKRLDDEPKAELQSNMHEVGEELKMCEVHMDR